MLASWHSPSRLLRCKWCVCRGGLQYVHAHSMRSRRTALFPVLEVPPVVRRPPLLYSHGVRPRYAMSGGGASNRRGSPSSATNLKAASSSMPRNARSDYTTGRHTQVTYWRCRSASISANRASVSVNVSSEARSGICWARWANLRSSNHARCASCCLTTTLGACDDVHKPFRSRRSIHIDRISRIV